VGAERNEKLYDAGKSQGIRSDDPMNEMTGQIEDVQREWRRGQRRG
jgi:hypothetical protein